ncbi:IS6 family transposase [Rhodovulum sulfidophilum]|nr:IS6 family transposase [Rhodovulum sulfidophilum]MBL3594281.1 IS6 family transposase [Rhodovulum sulfidophilum]
MWNCCVSTGPGDSIGVRQVWSPAISCDPFKGHRFPPDVIPLAVRCYCRFPLSYQDVTDLLAERGITMDRATVFRWVQKIGPEIARRAYNHRSWCGLNWHVDETYVRVGGKWRYLWRAVDQNGQFIDFRLTARRDVKAAKAFLKQAIERVRLYRPVSICTDEAPGYRKVIEDLNHRFEPCCTKPLVDSPRESSVIAGWPEQTDTADL